MKESRYDRSNGIFSLAGMMDSALDFLHSSATPTDLKKIVRKVEKSE
jgi:hypothetical protein